ncbi:MAG: sulfatase-like hydrolase/transferase [Pseudomonadota bacterium]
MPDRPHIIIFNPDQWRGDVMGHMGHPAVQTPVLDNLVASDAVSFRHAFVQATVCTPSRCSFMTGWYPHVRGHRTMHHMLNPELGETNLLKVLRDNGYFVWWGGKNDLVPGQLGFEDHCDIHFRPHRPDYERWGVTPKAGSHGGDLSWRGESDGDNYFSFFKGELDTGGESFYCDADWAMVLGAIDFLKSYDGDQPLCIFLPIGYPHPPYCVEEPWYSITDRDAIPERYQYDTWDDKPGLLSGIRDGQALTGWTEVRWRELRATYYGMCSRVDHQLGLLVEALKDSQLYDDSALFVFSDHGDFTGDYGLVEKTQNTFQDCLSRVPFIVKPPHSVATVNGIREQLVELVDFPAKS